MLRDLSRPPTQRRRPARFVIGASAEQVLLVASVFWAFAANRLFFAVALKERGLLEPATWGYALALLVALVALNFLLLATVATRWSLKPLLGVLIVCTALAGHFMQAYGVYLDPSMLRNVLRTDLHEARELLSWDLAAHLALYAAIPLAVLSRVALVERPWPRALAVRTASMGVAGVLLIGTVLALFQPLASLVRNHKEARYLITPANYLWSLARVASLDARAAVAPRRAIGLDAQRAAGAAAAARPSIVVLVVGETARAANWGLNGYARQTTPQLAALPVISFAQVDSCGTDTEVSLPCMFAPVGRRDYDQARIRGAESALHVLARAGVGVHWRDNQSGCKGVCDGLPNDHVRDLAPAAPCADGNCLDEALLHGLDARLAQAKGAQLLVLHMIGNHGPAYFRRYPPEFERFRPACRDDDLRRCTSEQIVNAYDNALLYTDHVLAQLIGTLQRHAGTVDAAVLYVSDHGESLGEGNLYLHGMPYAIAPLVQTRVPMLLWTSDGFASVGRLDRDCLRRRAASPASHDHLFHTLLGLFEVHSAVYELAWDLAVGCRGAATPAVAAR